ncbi:DUF1819 family protein [Magnetococcales bacterium HHB-1]
MKQYRANFTNGSLMVPESRLIAQLLLDQPTPKGWREAVIDGNILQKRTAKTASSLANLIRHRLQTMPKALWSIVIHGSPDATRHALLAATVTYSPLLGDFMLLVLQDLFQGFDKRLNPLSWEKYLEHRWSQDDAFPRWSDSTIAKLRQNGFRILTEAGFLSDTRTLTMKRVFIAPSVLSCLKDHRKAYALSCLQVAS